MVINSETYVYGLFVLYRQYMHVCTWVGAALYVSAVPVMLHSYVHILELTTNEQPRV